jgi:hypothetical protein
VFAGEQRREINALVEAMKLSVTSIQRLEKGQRMHFLILGLSPRMVA